MLQKLLQSLSYDIAIDLGTSQTLIYVKGRGIIAREPTVIAQHRKSKQIIAVGTQAKHMLGKTPESIRTIKPLRNGVISDYDAALTMMRYVMQRVDESLAPRRVSLKIMRPTVLINIPSYITEVEKKAVVDACLRVGARQVSLVENPMAAAYGAEMLVNEPLGSGIVVLGGGIIEMAIISLGGIVAGTTLKLGGDDFDQLIVSYIRHTYNVLIGDKTAEEIKIKVGSATFIRTIEDTFPVRGRDLRSGLPKTIEIKSDDVALALKSSLEEISRTLSDLIDAAPPEVMSDVLQNGIVLVGGSAQLRSLDAYLENSLKIPVRVADDPSTSVVRGAAHIIDNPHIYEKVRSLHK
ncbi:MAG: rod shape-determining protein [Patescibacteria group bacterium]|nr:MAG: rod shape-determining protein [Patescibacteria group bacterium]